jgi:hypothetical protein
LFPSVPDAAETEALARIRVAEIDALTPMAALNELHALKRLLTEGKP